MQQAGNRSCCPPRHLCAQSSRASRATSARSLQLKQSGQGRVVLVLPLRPGPKDTCHLQRLLLCNSAHECAGKQGSSEPSWRRCRHGTLCNRVSHPPLMGEPRAAAAAVCTTEAIAGAVKAVGAHPWKAGPS